MATNSTNYLAELRECLEYAKRTGMRFEQAWNESRSSLGAAEEWAGALAWAKVHFKAAYNDEPSPRGRFGPPSPEAGGTGTRVPVAELRPRGPAATCKAPDGCHEPAMCGRWEPAWCVLHGAPLELAAIELNTSAKRKIPGWAFPVIGTSAVAA